MTYRIRNWEKFQHYKDRSPPWIRLHKNLLDDYEFHCLPVASRALAPMLWLLASEHDDHMSGLVMGSDEKLAFRLRMKVADFREAIKSLISKGFLELVQDAINPLAECVQDATPETDSTETDSEVLLSSARAANYSESFEEFWSLYPRRDSSKSEASKSYNQAIKGGTTHGRLIEGVGAFRQHVERTGTEQRFIAHASTWLNQRRWESDYSEVQPYGDSRPAGPKQSKWIAEGNRLAAKYREAAERERQDAAKHSPVEDLRAATPIRDDRG